jgi:hypothetical protein
LGAVREIAAIQGRIADILFARGEPENALGVQLARLDLSRKLRDADGIAAALSCIAQIELAQKKTMAAFSHLVEAWPLFLRLGKAEGIAVVGGLLGQLLVAANRKDDGLSVLRRSADAYRTLGRNNEAQRIDEILAGLSA